MNTNTPLSIEAYTKEAVELLSELIRTPSISREEQESATVIRKFLKEHQVKVHQSGNNVWAYNKTHHPEKPSLLLNSHHDTVKPNAGYTKDPFDSIEEKGKLFGLGSNDAGASLVSLIMTFIHFYDKELPYNIVLAATAEEEISGKGGVSSILPELGAFEFGLVGEPTQMKMAVAEKGLMVLDCYVEGVSGHAARDEGVNAIYQSLEIINWFKEFEFEKISSHLGPIKMSVTVIDAGKQHNVVPDSCHFVVDVRTTDAYTNEEVIGEIRKQVDCQVAPRSMRLTPSFLPDELKIARVGERLGIEKFGSPTLSDQSLMNFPTFKMGPGDSKRSHTADEYIYLDEITEGIAGYIKLLEELFK
ncbi:MAG: M20 family metallo-hydrolase [Bacteroidota bacterium]